MILLDTNVLIYASTDRSPLSPSAGIETGTAAADAETSRGPRGLRSISFRAWDVSTASASGSSLVALPHPA